MSQFGDEIEIAWALEELATLGYLARSERGGDQYRITERGFERYQQFLSTLDIQDRLLIIFSSRIYELMDKDEEANA